MHTCMGGLWTRRQGRGKTFVSYLLIHTYTHKTNTHVHIPYKLMSDLYIIISLYVCLRVCVCEQCVSFLHFSTLSKASCFFPPPLPPFPVPHSVTCHGQVPSRQADFAHTPSNRLTRKSSLTVFLFLEISSSFSIGLPRLFVCLSVRLSVYLYYIDGSIVMRMKYD